MVALRAFLVSVQAGLIFWTIQVQSLPAWDTSASTSRDQQTPQNNAWQENPVRHTIWQPQPDFGGSGAVELLGGRPLSLYERHGPDVALLHAAIQKLPLTLAERQYIAQAPWYHNPLSGQTHFRNSLRQMPVQPSNLAAPRADQEQARVPLMQHENTVTAELDPVRAQEVSGEHTSPYVDATESQDWSDSQEVQADQAWVPPTERTDLQKKLETFFIPFRAKLLKPRAEGAARFYGATRDRSHRMALLRYPVAPNLAEVLSLHRLSGQRLTASTKVWKQLRLRMLFAETPAVAYGLVDAQLLKGFFPGMDPRDKAKLLDGMVAIIHVEKVGRNHAYRLFSVLNPDLVRL